MSAPQVTPPQFQIALQSDTGRSRSNNQDFAYAGPLPGAEEWTLLAVADGLGGHAHGEWASQRAIELVVASLAGHLQSGTPRAAFEDAVAEANSTINAEAPQQGAPGAATTFVAVLFRGADWWWCNVGDSRLYFLSGGVLQQVSDDHAWVADQVRAGLLSPDAASHHPNKNVVTRTIGFESVVTPDTGGPLVIKPGEALVLCSDGLHGPVADDEIGRAVTALEPGAAAKWLIEMANSAGGPDNITVVIGKLIAPDHSVAETQIAARPRTNVELPRPRHRSTRRLALVALGLALVAGVAIGVVVAQI